ncbi:hypothetical protein JTE90_008159 [Oedothorax gibbosus]|uniref:Uncharacterized protein n=1 Tax=Oedothorax gibbosus TaxID=931172 RepID=A0AAV6VH64_9ARAC|nr:hypothetical protein JTE90_008159 [Oedothorax gibbosus]
MRPAKTGCVGKCRSRIFRSSTPNCPLCRSNGWSIVWSVPMIYPGVGGHEEFVDDKVHKVVTVVNSPVHHHVQRERVREWGDEPGYGLLLAYLRRVLPVNSRKGVPATRVDQPVLIVACLARA